MGLVSAIRCLFWRGLNDKTVRTSESTHQQTTAGDVSYSFAKQDLLCKFVMQDKERIGEIISTDSGHLVVKKQSKNLYIPFSSIIEITDEDIVVGLFDMDKALKLGEEWQARTTDTLNFDDNGMLIND